MASAKDFATVRKLGSGVSGTVRLVRRLADNQLYALKEVELHSDPDQAGSALQETHILASLENGFITRYYDSFIENNCLYMVMEYASNGSLHDVLCQSQEPRRHLSEDTVWRYMLQLLIGLHEIHARNVVHRDIKPHNIFLGENDTVKIGDFGVSRLLSNAREMATTVVGSPGYLPPELCNGEPYNEKADIWSLGVTLAEMCLLKHPYGDAASQAALILKIMEARPPTLPDLYSAELSRTLAACFSRLPARRPSALQFLSSAPVRARADTFNLAHLLPEAARRVAPAREAARPQLSGELGSERRKARAAVGRGGVARGADSATSFSHDRPQAQVRARRHTRSTDELYGAQPAAPQHAVLGAAAASASASASARGASCESRGGDVAPSGFELRPRQLVGANSSWKLKPVCAAKRGSGRAANSMCSSWGSDHGSSTSSLGDVVAPRRKGLDAACASRPTARRHETDIDFGIPEGGVSLQPAISSRRSHHSSSPPTLWAKRRDGAAASPGLLADHLRDLSTELNPAEVPQGVSSPLDKFAACHCPVRLTRAISSPNVDGSGAPLPIEMSEMRQAMSASSPLAVLLKREFPRAPSALGAEAPSAAMPPMMRPAKLDFTDFDAPPGPLSDPAGQDYSGPPLSLSTRSSRSRINC